MSSHKSLYRNKSVICCLHGLPCSKSGKKEIEVELQSGEYNRLVETFSRPDVISKKTSEKSKKHLSKKNALKTKENKMNAQELDIGSIYLGKLKRIEAQKRCKGLATFYLYHRKPSHGFTTFEKFAPVWPLFIVYRTSRGDYCNYKVIIRPSLKDPNKKEFGVKLADEPFQSSLNELVKFYITYEVFQYKDGPGDAFPWWLDSGNHLTRKAVYQPHYICKYQSTSDEDEND